MVKDPFTIAALTCSNYKPSYRRRKIGYWDDGIVDWSSLPQELLQAILMRITENEDYVHFRAVCKPWRSSVSPRPRHLPPQSPWLMLSYDENTDICNFLCVPTSREYKFPLPEARGKRCCGSSHGWLVLLDNSHGASLLNPLTRDSIQLPPVTAFPTIQDLWLEEEDDVNWEAVNTSRNLHDYILEKIVLSDSPAIEGAIALAIVSERMVFCRIGDPVWTVVNEWSGFFTDAIYHDGKFYVLDCMGGLFTLEVGSSPMVRTVIPSHPNHAIQRYITVADGDILMVSRIRHVCDPQSHACGPTVAFEVSRLSRYLQWPVMWTPIHGLNGDSLFVGVNQSFCLRPEDYPGYLGDCVYFTDDFCWRYKGEEDVDGIRNDFGIFDVPNGRSRLMGCGIDRSRYIWPTPKWVTPSLC